MRRRSLGAELAHRGVVADERRAVELGRERHRGRGCRRRSTSGRRCRPARRDGRCRAAAPPSLRGRPSACGRGGVEEPPADDRAAEGPEQAGVGRVDRDAAGLLAGRSGRCDGRWRPVRAPSRRAGRRPRASASAPRCRAASRRRRRASAPAPTREQIRPQAVDLVQQARARGLRDARGRRPCTRCRWRCRGPTGRPAGARAQAHGADAHEIGEEQTRRHARHDPSVAQRDAPWQGGRELAVVRDDTPSCPRR